MKKAIRGCFRITNNEEITPGIFELCIETPEIAAAATAGQFINVYLPGGATLLPRPISLADASDRTITVAYAVVGKGTTALSAFEAGEKVEVMGPLGTGFFDYPGSEKMANRVLLIGGGAGIPPLYFAARRLRAAFRGRIKIEAFLGFREYPWYVKEFESICDIVKTCSETEGMTAFHGNVVGLLDAAYRQSGVGKVFALSCGPSPMLQAVSFWCDERAISLRLSLEERMGCGYGACAGCIVKTRPLNDAKKLQNGVDVIRFTEQTTGATHAKGAAPDRSEPETDWRQAAAPTDPDHEGIIRKKVCVHGPVFWSDEVIW